MTKYIYTFFIGLSLGLVLSFKLIKKEPEPTKQEKTKVITKTITKPSGDIYKLERIYIDSKEAPQKPYKPRYSIGLSGLTSVDYVSPESRLGDLPLFIGVDVNTHKIDDSKLRLRYEF